MNVRLKDMLNQVTSHFFLHRWSPENSVAMCKKSAKDEFIQAETCVEKGKTLV